MKLDSPLHQLAALERGFAWTLACASAHDPSRYTRECVRFASRELSVLAGSCDALLSADRTGHRPPTKRKAPRLTGTERDGNINAHTVTSAVVSVNGLTLGDAAQRQEVGNEH